MLSRLCSITTTVLPVSTRRCRTRRCTRGSTGSLHHVPRCVGPHKGRKAFLLQSLAPRGEEHTGECVAQANGFSLHAGIAAEAEQRQKLERLCRYIARPAVAIERLSRSAQGTIRYALKTPYRDGTTHVIFEPLDFLARLASLVGRHDPRSQAMIRRKHPVVTRQVHSRTRHQFGRTKPTQKEARAAPRHVAMSWAQRLKRVFDIDIETCEHCGGTLKIISVLRTRS